MRISNDVRRLEINIGVRSLFSHSFAK